MIKDSKGNELNIGDKVVMNISKELNQEDSVYILCRSIYDEQLFLRIDHDKIYATRTFRSNEITKL